MASCARDPNGNSLDTTGPQTVRRKGGILARIHEHAHATLPPEEANKAWDLLARVLVPLCLPASVEDETEPNLVLARAQAPKYEMALGRWNC